MARKILCDRCGEEIRIEDESFSGTFPKITEDTRFKSIKANMTDTTMIEKFTADICRRCIESFSSWWQSCPVKGAMK